MPKTLERYQKCSYGSLEDNQPVSDNQLNGYHEYLRLKARLEILQQSQSNLLGEELESLNIKELEQLEKQLEMSLKQIRSARTQSMLDQLADLQRREQMLAETNKGLRRKLEENNFENPRPSWEATGQPIHYSHPPPHSEGFYQPLGLNSNLQIGYNPVDSNEMNGTTPTQNVNEFIPEWML